MSGYPGAPRALATIALQELTADALVGNGKQWQGTCCPICLQDYASGQEVLVASCGHFAHSECAEPWLDAAEAAGRTPTCFMCRIDIVRIDTSSAGDASTTDRSSPGPARGAGMAVDRESTADTSDTDTLTTLREHHLAPIEHRVSDLHQMVHLLHRRQERMEAHIWALHLIILTIVVVAFIALLIYFDEQEEALTQPAWP